MGQERREFHRILFQKAVTLNCGVERETHLIDISLKGVLIETPEGNNYEMGTSCSLTIPLSDDGSESIEMTATLAHHENGHLGFAWQDIDVESFSHLRRLLELNTGDSEAINRELSALGGNL